MSGKPGNCCVLQHFSMPLFHIYLQHSPLPPSSIPYSSLILNPMPFASTFHLLLFPPLLLALTPSPFTFHHSALFLSPSFLPFSCSLTKQDRAGKGKYNTNYDQGIVILSYMTRYVSGCPAHDEQKSS